MFGPRVSDRGSAGADRAGASARVGRRGLPRVGGPVRGTCGDGGELAPCESHAQACAGRRRRRAGAAPRRRRAGPLRSPGPGLRPATAPPPGPPACRVRRPGPRAPRPGRVGSRPGDARRPRRAGRAACPVRPARVASAAAASRSVSRRSRARSPGRCGRGPADPQPFLGHVRHDPLGGVGRGGGPVVGDEVEQRGVRLVADRADHRGAAGGDRPHQRLVGERQQVLDASRRRGRRR